MFHLFVESKLHVIRKRYRKTNAHLIRFAEQFPKHSRAKFVESSLPWSVEALQTESPKLFLSREGKAEGGKSTRMIVTRAVTFSCDADMPAHESRARNTRDRPALSKWVLWLFQLWSRINLPSVRAHFPSLLPSIAYKMVQRSQGSGIFDRNYKTLRPLMSAYLALLFSPFTCLVFFSSSFFRSSQR